MNDNSVCEFFCIALLFGIIGAVVTNKVRDKYPQAIDVYQGKTTLEYTIIDGEIVDSVVVFNNK